MTFQYAWTNNESIQIQQLERDAVLHKWSSNTLGPFGELELAPPHIGETFALMYIPRLRNEVWGMPILEGADDAQLSGGVGHYPGTALPGQDGNFATFGHRTTHGQPYAHIELLELGDQIFVRTEQKWFVYTLVVDEIVLPADVWVIYSDAMDIAQMKSYPAKSIITLIACTPRHSTKQRWVWWGELTDVREIKDSPL